MDDNKLPGPDELQYTIETVNGHVIMVSAPNAFVAIRRSGLPMDAELSQVISRCSLTIPRKRTRRVL